VFLLELIVDGIVEVWFSFMQLIVPNKAFGKVTRIVLKILTWIFSCLLLFVMLLGVLLGIITMISDDVDTHSISSFVWNYMVFLPLGISAVQIIFGFIVCLIERRKEK